MERPRATEALEGRKSQALLLVLDCDSRDSAVRGQIREIDDRSDLVVGHRAMKGARRYPDRAIPAVPRVTVHVDEETLAAHDGMLGGHVRWVRRVGGQEAEERSRRRDPRATFYIHSVQGFLGNSFESAGAPVSPSVFKTVDGA